MLVLIEAYFDAIISKYKDCGFIGYTAYYEEIFSQIDGAKSIMDCVTTIAKKLYSNERVPIITAPFSNTTIFTNLLPHEGTDHLANLYKWHTTLKSCIQGNRSSLSTGGGLGGRFGSSYTGMRQP